MKTFDAVVIGSGFGGAVAACRLAERGRSVLVLERGRRWGREDFPRPEKPNAGWRWSDEERGLFERRVFPQMQVIVAAGVGGGSLVYTNVQKVPPAEVFTRWPEPISLDYLRPYYERVKEMLEPAPVPDELPRLRALEQAHLAAGLPARVERPDLAIRFGSGDAEVANKFGASQKPCDFCGDCVLGCDRHAKNTLDLTYLKRAEALGAEIWPLCEATRLASHADGHEISLRRLTDDSHTMETVCARSVFSAAGSLGTTGLLLRARDLDRTLPNLSPRLGQQWSANGDFFAGLLDSRLPIVPTYGPSVAGAADATDEGFYVLEGAIPSSLACPESRWARRGVALATRMASLLRLSFSHRPLDSAAVHSCGDEETAKLLRHAGAFFLMGRDASDGRLALDAKGNLQLLWNWRESEPLLSRMRRYLEELGRGYGGAMLVPQPWWPLTLGTVHPLGGCPMGRNASEGVVDSFGRVFGCPNLYVCDASIIPRALGVPPSMTIAALAEHIAEHAVIRDL
ncbi:MAG TPA: GMC family oxidoreductase [Candidatus Acidoferrales bacterium]|nr:GMC family oxidoreductase [Candidatus Acidoferrales bacterium]